MVGIVGLNAGTRKLLPVQIMALSHAAKRLHKDNQPILFLHTDITGESHPLGFDLRPVIKASKLDVMMHDQTELTTEDIALLYNRFTLLLNATAGEGFGLPILEAQACGTPVVTAANSCGWENNANLMLVADCPGDEYVPALDSWYSWPNIESISECIRNGLTRHQDAYSVYSQRAREIATKFTTERVRQHWEQYLHHVKPEQTSLPTTT